MVDLSGALELPDALVTQNDEAIFVGDDERLMFQRFEVNTDYSFTLVGESPTMACYVNAPRGQIIVFDPTSMQITGDIQVPEVLRDDSGRPPAP